MLLPGIYIYICTMAHLIPASTHAVESCVISSPIDTVWAVISALDFAWWGLVRSAVLTHGTSASAVGAVVVYMLNVINVIILSD